MSGRLGRSARGWLLLASLGMAASASAENSAPAESAALSASLGRAETASAPTTFVESALPITPPPPEPVSVGEQGLPPEIDPAGGAARSIRKRVARFPNLRALIPGAVWNVHAGRVWSIRSARVCLDELDQAGVPFRPVTRPLSTPVPTPVVVTGDVQGVRFQVAQDDRELELSCELALRLPALARILKGFDVHQVVISSSYRDHPKVSFHTFGFALDLAAFQVGKRTLWVGHGFEQTPDVLTCAGAPRSDDARLLLRIACALADSGLFSSVLTPNYNAGHRDHLHLDVRPDDPRFFVR